MVLWPAARETAKQAGGSSLLVKPRASGLTMTLRLPPMRQTWHHGFSFHIDLPLRVGLDLPRLLLLLFATPSDVAPGLVRATPL